MWTTFESLCQLERHVDSTEFFKATQIPSFMSEKFMSNMQKKLDAGKPIIPVTSNKESSVYITPDIFTNPTLNKVVASSTPALPGTMALHFDSDQHTTPGQVSPQVLNFSATPPPLQLSNEYSLILSSTKLKMKNVS